MNPTSALEQGKSGGFLPGSLPRVCESWILAVKRAKVRILDGFTPKASGEDEPRSGGRYGYFCNRPLTLATAPATGLY